MGIPTLISTSTASDSSSIDITSGIDSTYDEYMFVFTDINPATDEVQLQFQVNAAGGSGFNETMTTTVFYAYHDEADSNAVLAYEASFDQAQGTAYQTVLGNQGNGADECGVGELHLFNPASTTYVKHFCSQTNTHHNNNWSIHNFTAGYINTTSAIDEISFKMNSGNFDGVIQMYGIA
jgi:hypothetical protein